MKNVFTQLGANEFIRVRREILDQKHAEACERIGKYDEHSAEAAYWRGTRDFIIVLIHEISY